MESHYRGVITHEPRICYADVIEDCWAARMYDAFESEQLAPNSDSPDYVLFEWFALFSSSVELILVMQYLELRKIGNLSD